MSESGRIEASSYAVVMKDVGFAYDQREVLRGVSLEVRPGEIFALLGPNGSGKSTLFKLISTIAAPSSGTIRIFGFDVVEQMRLARQCFGVVFQNPALDRQLTAMENIYCHARLFGLSSADIQNRATDLLTRFGLMDRANEYVSTFSGGMRRKVELAKAVITRPKLLILDEPSTGLDLTARLDFWKIIDGLRRSLGMSILLTTHLMDEADRCDRIAILDKGQVLACDRPDVLKENVGGDIITFSGPHPEQLKALVEDKFNLVVKEVGLELRVQKDQGHLFIPHLIAAVPGMINSISLGRPTLDDVFIQLTGRHLREDSKDE